MTGVSSPPWITNLRGRMLAATRMPLTATGNGPGNTPARLLICARSGANAAAIAAAIALLTRLLRGDALRGARARLHHHLDGIVDALARIFDRSRQILEREGMRVNFRRVEALLRHEGLGAVRRALALAADAEQVDVVAHDVRHIDRCFLMREGGQTYLAAAIDHADRVVHGIRRAGALDDVVDALAAVEPAHGLDRIFVARIDDVIGTELEADFQPVVARAGQDHRRGAERLGHRHTPHRDAPGPR